MFLLISYDITCNKARKKASDFLKNYGLRVQKSVFECRVNMRQYAEIKQKLKTLINQKTDGVCFYRFCQGCLGKVEIYGKPGVEEDDLFCTV